MAKELPYFKFEPSEWDSGTVQMCSMEAQGLFINLCCLYWSRLGNLPYKLAMQKQCKGYANALQELCDEEIIEVSNDFITIRFLDEQLLEFNKKSVKARESAQKRWSKPKGGTKNANALPSESESNAIREDKNREDKNKTTLKSCNVPYEKFGKAYFQKLEEKGKIKSSQKINDAWLDPLRLMVERDLVDLNEMTETAKKYFERIEEPFIQECFSTKSFREKYFKLKSKLNQKDEPVKKKSRSSKDYALQRAIKHAKENGIDTTKPQSITIEGFQPSNEP